MNAQDTLVNVECPCCTIERGLPDNPNVEPRVCKRHYTSENAEWQKHLAARKLVQRQYDANPSFVERYQDNVEGYWDAL